MSSRLNEYAHIGGGIEAMAWGVTRNSSIEMLYERGREGREGGGEEGEEEGGSEWEWDEREEEERRVKGSKKMEGLGRYGIDIVEIL